MADTRRSVNFWIAAQVCASTILLLLALVLAGFAVQHRIALCAFKEDLQARTNATREVLAEQPGDPIRYFGLIIPRTELESDLQNRERTLESLEAIRWCHFP
jgi:hypothetical protein